LKGGEYLEQLLTSDALLSQPSPVLDKLYALKSIPKLTQQDNIPLGTPNQELLISKDQLSEIAQKFKDNEISVLGKRAIVQITKQLEEDVKKREEEQKKEEEAKNEVENVNGKHDDDQRGR
jgi:hypothetical protein